MFWRVYTKVARTSPWKDTGIVESNKLVALAVWPSILARLGHYEFKLEGFDTSGTRNPAAPPIVNGWATAAH